MPTPRSRRSRRAAAAIALLGVAAIALRAVPGPAPAAAAVRHETGYAATVLGWTSWYGSYALDGIGVGYCIDHGLRAPDADLGYAPTPVEDQTPQTRAAIAWVVGAYGVEPDPPLAAAVMLALHDLMGASYPGGPIDVDAMQPWQLAGFAGDESRVLDLARVVKADGLAHSALVGPLRLSVEPPPVRVGEPVELVVRLTDAAGRPVAGIAVQLAAAGATLGSPSAVTGADGAARVTMTATQGDNTIVASAEPPDPELRAYASTSAPAQRAAMPARTRVEASTSFSAVPPGRALVHKTGAPGGPPVTGASFTIHTVDGGAVASFTVGADGWAGPFELAAGDYGLVEDAPPPGYQRGGPWAFSVAPNATTTIEAVNVPIAPPPPTTTTTTMPTTTTTTPGTAPAPTTSTTLAPTSTTTIPPTTTSTTSTSTTTTTSPATSPSTTTTSTPAAAPAATSPPPRAPATVLAEVPVARPLPRTGSDPLPLAATGAGLALLGTSLVRTATSRARPRGGR